MENEGFNLPTDDAFVEILLHLPTSARRRFRLVCKRWRDVIDERTLERQVRTKILAFISDGPSSRAIVFDDKDGRRRHEWTYDSATRGSVYMVGTCNGLICLRDTGADARSVITVANPITGEAVALPPLPAASSYSLVGLGLYGFGYHPTKGRYKVVRVTSPLAQRPGAAHVLTLGGGPAAWREVTSPAMGGGHCPFPGIVSVDGSMYWFSCSDRVVALDLGDERVTSFQGPPGLRLVGGMGKASPSWKLTCVHARLGVTVPRYETAGRTIEVWVLDGGGGGGEQPRWSRRYKLAETGYAPNRNEFVLAPHLTHGEYILSMSPDGKQLYRRKVGGGGGGTNVEEDRRDAPLRQSEGAELIMSEENESRLLWTFAYAETREPLPSVGA